MALPPRGCSHVHAMRYESEECWCEDCGTRWRLTWRTTPDGKRIPAAWTPV